MGTKMTNYQYLRYYFYNSLTLNYRSSSQTKKHTIWLEHILEREQIVERESE